MTGEITTAKTEAAPGQVAKMLDAHKGAGGSSKAHVDAEFDKATEKRLIRKLDQRLVLLAFLCCMCTLRGE